MNHFVKAAAKVALAAGFLALLSSCADPGNITVAELAPKKMEVRAGESQIVIYGKTPTGIGVFVDDAPTGAKCGYGVFLVDVSPGEHVVSAFTESRSSAVVNAPEGGRVYVRCTLSSGFFVRRPRLRVVVEAAGKSAISDLPFMGRF